MDDSINSTTNCHYTKIKYNQNDIINNDNDLRSYINIVNYKIHIGDNVYFVEKNTDSSYNIKDKVKSSGNNNITIINEDVKICFQTPFTDMVTSERFHKIRFFDNIARFYVKEETPNKGLRGPHIGSGVMSLLFPQGRAPNPGDSSSDDSSSDGGDNPNSFGLYVGPRGGIFKFGSTGRKRYLR